MSRILLLVMVATASMQLAWSLENSPLLVRWFGPASNEMREAYADDVGTATADHRDFDAILRDHVRGGRVDYAGLAADEAQLDRYLEQLAVLPFDDLSRDDKLAALINAYNAFTLKLILDHQPLASIKDIPARDRWDAPRWNFAGRMVSLSALEHEELRVNFIEPRVHFAINCASVGCPPLRAEAYTGARIETQLEEQTAQMHQSDTWLQIAGDTVRLTPLYLWYADDFAQVAGSARAFAARYRPELADEDVRIVWSDYDWSLNDAEDPGGVTEAF
ncbi:MAG: DUF547 domain-containing protein [Myxococcota bacterium]